MPVGSFAVFDQRLALRISAEQRAELDQVAWDERRDISDLVREAITSYLATRDAS